ncbi:MAG: hypothetical protein IPI10_08860 [Bacteroidetes bacterium]|nr:hypothetical protein [Bacteroidota bacterium]
MINHQFLNTEIYIPQWTVKFLFLGTFNPEGGAVLDYYYRRPSNGFWKILKLYFDPYNNIPIDTYEGLVAFMKKFGIGCIDIINTVECPDHYVERIIGQGYSDAALFTVNGLTRHYNFENIQNFISNQSIKPFVFSTWGQRENPADFFEAKSGFLQYCDLNNIPFTSLASPSGRVYRGINIPIINENWHDSFDNCLQLV